MTTITREQLERLYRRWNHREYVAPDPLELLYDYPETADREIAGFIAASLAYGRVARILKSARTVLEPMGATPRDFVLHTTDREFLERYRGFKHRFTDEADLVALLSGLRRTLETHGSLEACFVSHLSPRDETTIPALTGLADEIRRAADRERNSLLPCPSRGSACKRMHLFLRWMVRHDEVDPGGWHVDPALLVIPLDTHMHTVCRSWGITSRAGAGQATALEITRWFAALTPEDPVRYDFALTRPGIRPDEDQAQFLAGGW